MYEAIERRRQQTKKKRRKHMMKADRMKRIWNVTRRKKVIIYFM